MNGLPIQWGFGLTGETLLTLNTFCVDIFDQCMIRVMENIPFLWTSCLQSSDSFSISLFSVVLIIFIFIFPFTFVHLCFDALFHYYSTLSSLEIPISWSEHCPWVSRFGLLSRPFWLARVNAEWRDHASRSQIRTRCLMETRKERVQSGTILFFLQFKFVKPAQSEAKSNYNSYVLWSNRRVQNSMSLNWINPVNPFKFRPRICFSWLFSWGCFTSKFPKSVRPNRCRLFASGQPLLSPLVTTITKWNDCERPACFSPWVEQPISCRSNWVSEWMFQHHLSPFIHFLLPSTTKLLCVASLRK